MIPIIQEPSNECPVCRLIKPAHFFTCRPCFKDTPFDLWKERKTAQGIAHHQPTPPNLHRIEQAEKAILQHLRLHGTAIV